MDVAHRRDVPTDRIFTVWTATYFSSIAKGAMISSNHIQLYS